MLHLIYSTSVHYAYVFYSIPLYLLTLWARVRGLCHLFLLFLHPCSVCLCEIWVVHESPAKAKMGSKNFFPLFVSFSLYCNVVVLVLVASLSFLSGSLATFGLGCFSLLVSKSAPLPSSSLCVLIGPGLPLPTDAAPPTTAQCIRPAAPRDCPRASLSLFPRSSSPVRWGRGEGVEDDCNEKPLGLSGRREMNTVLLECGWLTATK